MIKVSDENVVKIILVSEALMAFMQQPSSFYNLQRPLTELRVVYDQSNANRLTLVVTSTTGKTQKFVYERPTKEAVQATVVDIGERTTSTPSDQEVHDGVRPPTDERPDGAQV